MKNLILLAFVFLSILSCKEDKEFNTPAFEGTKNNARWNAQGQTAFTDEDGNFSIKGEIASETVILTVPTRTAGVYALSSGSGARAIFTELDGTIYSTENEPDASLTIYPVGGTLLIDEISTVNSSVSGRFQFSAFTTDGLKGVTFSGDANNDSDSKRYGVFYRVNVFGPPPVVVPEFDPVACAAAQVQSATTETAFALLDRMDLTYSTQCSAFVQTLQTQITTCGDPTGAIQAKINTLGTCIFDTVACTNAETQSSTEETALALLMTTDPTYSATCNMYKQTLQTQILICGDATGTIQAKIVALGTCP